MNRNVKNPFTVFYLQVRVIAQNFVSDRNTPEAITVGLNTIREIFATCPAAATEEMVRDLSEVSISNSFFYLKFAKFSLAII